MTRGAQHKIKHETRGRRTAFIVPRTHSAPASERRALDVEALAAVWDRKSVPRPPDALLTRLADLCAGGQAATQTSLYISTSAPLGKALNKVRAQAEKLAKSLESLDRMDGGHALVEGLGIGRPMFLSDELRQAIHDAFRVGHPAEFHRVLIYDIHAAFVEFGQNDAVHEASLLVEVLKEVNRQIPGIVRDSDSQSALWRNRVDKALGSERAALRK